MTIYVIVFACAGLYIEQKLVFAHVYVVFIFYSECCHEY